MVSESDTAVHFYKVRSHTDVVGNESNDAIAKHAALHNPGHDKAFPPPSPGGNPFSHVFWLAEDKNDTANPTIRTSLAPLQNIKDKLEALIS